MKESLPFICGDGEIEISSEQMSSQQQGSNLICFGFTVEVGTQHAVCIWSSPGEYSTCGVKLGHRIYILYLAWALPISFALFKLRLCRFLKQTLTYLSSFKEIDWGLMSPEIFELPRRFTCVVLCCIY